MPDTPLLCDQTANPRKVSLGHIPYPDLAQARLALQPKPAISQHVVQKCQLYILTLLPSATQTAQLPAAGWHSRTRCAEPKSQLFIICTLYNPQQVTAPVGLPALAVIKPVKPPITCRPVAYKPGLGDTLHSVPDRPSRLGARQEKLAETLHQC